MFQHFLITRFNVKNKDWTKTKEGEDVTSEKWLLNRFDLFEKFCLPSVQAQSNGNFCWLIFFDISTSIPFQERAIAYTHSNQFIRVCFVDGIDNLVPAIQNAIKKEIKPNISHVITSRMDNDDAIHRDYINVIQKNYTPEDELLVDLRRGLQLNLEKGFVEIRNYYNEFNPFLSLIEKNHDNLKTVFFKWHRHWEGAAKVTIESEKELWMEVVHKSNQVNAVLVRQKKNYLFQKDEFGLNALDYKPEPFHLIFFNNLSISISKYKSMLRMKISQFLPKGIKVFTRTIINRLDKKKLRY